MKYLPYLRLFYLLNYIMAGTQGAVKSYRTQLGIFSFQPL